MISDNLQKQIIEAMKAKDSLRVSTLRMLSSELKNAQIDKQEDLNEEEELRVVKREAKKRRDAIEAFQLAQSKDSKSGYDENIKNEQTELEILQGYLPEEMSDEDLGKLVDAAIRESDAKTLADMGKVMPFAMAKAAGQADGKRVSELVKSKLSE